MVDSREGSDEAHPIHDVCLISLMSPSLSHSRSLVQQINVLACSRFITVPPGKVSLHFYYSKLFSEEMLHQEINYATDAKKRGLCRLKLSARPFLFPAPFQFLVTFKIHRERDVIKALQLCPEVFTSAKSSAEYLSRACPEGHFGVHPATCDCQVLSLTVVLPVLLAMPGSCVLPKGSGSVAKLCGSPIAGLSRAPSRRLRGEAPRIQLEEAVRAAACQSQHSP